MKLLIIYLCFVVMLSILLKIILKVGKSKATGYIHYNNYRVNDVQLSINVDVKEISKTVNKTKVEFLMMHISPNDYNTDFYKKHFKKHLNPWVDNNTINYYNNRKDKIKNLYK